MTAVAQSASLSPLMWAVLLYYMRNQCLPALSRSCLYIYLWGGIHTVQSAPDESFPFPSQLCPGSGAASFSIAVDGLSLLRVMQVGPHCIKVFCLICGVCVSISCSIVPRCEHTPVSTMKCTWVVYERIMCGWTFPFSRLNTWEGRGWVTCSVILVRLPVF